MKVTRLRQSVGDALRGLTFTFSSEQNFRIQIVGALVVFLGAWYFHLPLWQIIVLLLLVALVLILELINTAVEYFTDLIKPRMNHYVATIKDIMAGAVLVASLTAFIIGLMIFLPYFLALVK